MSRGVGKRVLYLWFHRLAADRVIRREGIARAEPVAIVTESKGAVRLGILSRAAEETGLSAGMTLADARAAVPDILTRMEDPGAQERLLASLHRWAHRFSPFIAIEEPDALALDITGCAHLFGGEQAMLRQIRQEADGLGFETRAGLADTKGAARALALHSGREEATAPAGETFSRLQSLPVSALGRDGRHLRRLGLRTLGDVAGLSGAELTKRFGAALTRRLEETLGRSATPVAPTAMQRRYQARLTFPDPIGLASDVTAAVERIVDVLCDKLEAEARGITALEMIVQRADGSSDSRSIGMARPSIDRPAIMRQWAPVIAAIDAGFGIDVIRLVVRGHAPLDVAQTSLTEVACKGSLDDLIGTLGNRLGFDRVTYQVPRESHLPGFNQAHVPAVNGARRSSWNPPATPGPVRLFPAQPLEPLAAGRPPERFRWRGRTLSLRRAQGPRRVMPEWWQNEKERRQARDYWRVEAETGERLWLGTDPKPRSERTWLVYGEIP